MFEFDEAIWKSCQAFWTAGVKSTKEDLEPESETQQQIQENSKYFKLLR